MYRLISQWYRDWVQDPKLEKAILAKSLESSVDRAVYLSLLFAMMFPIYGITIHEYLLQFQSDIPFWGNLWPRILINTSTFLVAAILIKSIPISNMWKVLLWFGLFAGNMHAASWIYVWPIILSGKPEVLGFIHAANITSFSLVFLLLAVPNRYLIPAVILVSIIFWLPLGFVLNYGNNPSYVKMILTDVIQGMIVNCVGSSFISRLRVRSFELEMRQKREAEKFLGTTVSKAIFNNRGDLLEDRMSSGFVMSIDIRGYTNLLKQFPKQMISKFIEHYHEMVSQVTEANGGVIHKTAGDGHLICFGILDEMVDLSDIPGIEDEEKQALRKRNSHLLKKALTASEEIVVSARKMAVSYLGISSLKIGIGIDYGDVHIKVFGGEHMRKELDVFGIPVNCATRLEAHTKLLDHSLGQSMEKNRCYIVLSPAAAEFLDRKQELRVCSVGDKPVRDFPDIKELFVKEVGDQNISNVAYFAA